MSRRINALERLVELAARLPWWSGLIAAAGSWLALHALTLNAAPLPREGVALPAARGLALAAQVMLPAAFLLLSAWSAWLGYRHQRNYAAVAAEQGGSVLQKLSGREFENLVAEFFRRKGFAVEQRAARMPEAGVDLIASIGEDRYLVQCKHWRVQRVGVAVVRELCAVAAAEGAAGVFVVTSGSFTDEARRHLESHRITIELITGEQLRRMIRGLDPVAA